MNKVIIFLFLSTLLLENTLHAYNKGNSAATKYYNGEISTDQYLDSLGVPCGQQQETTIYHSNGSKSLIRSNSNGGTVYNSDGSKSVYYQSH